MKLSVITICYNEKNIRKTCESIVNQSWQDFEWIVVDGGSTDGTLDILSEYKDRIDLLISEPDNGVYNAMNKGIVKAAGDWLNFMNGGDAFYDNNVLEKVFGGGKDYDASILYGQAYLSYHKYIRLYDQPIDEKFFIGRCINHQAAFIRREIFPKYGLYNEQLKIISDLEKWIQCALGGEKFYYLPFLVSDFYDCGISSGMTKETWQLHTEERILVLQKYYSREDILKYGRKPDKIRMVDPVITLTSYPARIRCVGDTVKSLMAQTIPAKIVLWLGESEFPGRERDLPPDLAALRKEGLEIRYTKDIGPYTKLVPALKAFPEKVLITVDDDILYPEDWLQNLLAAYVENPDMIHAARCNLILFAGRKIAPYRKWNYEARKLSPSFNNFLTGVGGVLYPPHCLYPDVLNEELFLSLAPKADDIWFWAMAVLNDVKINLIAKPYNRLKMVPGSQKEGCLWQENVIGGGNDVQLAAVLAHYPQIMDKLNKKAKLKRWQTKARHYLFAFIPLLKVREDRDGNRLYSLFNVLPLWRSRTSPGGKRVKHYLLGFIPLFKSRQK